MLLTLQVSFILHSPSQKPIKLQLFDVSNWMLARKNQCIKINCPLLRFHIIYLFIHLSAIHIHTSVLLSIHPSNSLSVHLSLCPSVCLFLFTRQFICLSVCFFIRWSIHPFTHSLISTYGIIVLHCSNTPNDREGVLQ